MSSQYLYTIAKVRRLTSWIKSPSRLSELGTARQTILYKIPSPSSPFSSRNRKHGSQRVECLAPAGICELLDPIKPIVLA